MVFETSSYISHICYSYYDMNTRLNATGIYITQKKERKKLNVCRIYYKIVCILNEGF